MGRKPKQLKVIKKPAETHLKDYTPAEREAARYMAGLFTMTKVMQAVAIAWFCGDEKYYRILGYSTEQEFMEMFAGKGRRQGLKYKEIGQSYLKSYPIEIPDEVFPEVEKSKGQNVQLLHNPTPLIPLKTSEMQKFAAFVEKIGIEKFYSLTQYDINYKELVDSEAVVLKNGERMPLEDVIASSNRDLLAKIEDLDGRLRDTRKDLTTERARSDERIKTLESEAEHLRDIEKKYGELSVRQEQKQDDLRDGITAHRASHRALIRANVKEDDGPTLKKDLLSIIHEIESDLKTLKENYGYIMIQATEE